MQSIHNYLSLRSLRSLWLSQLPNLGLPNLGSWLLNVNRICGNARLVAAAGVHALLTSAALSILRRFIENDINESGLVTVE